MQIKHEIRYYGKNEKVWVGKYRNSQNLSHWHTDCELVYSEKGSFEIMCDKNVYRLNCGQAFFIDSEQLHYIRAEQPDNILTTVFFTYGIIKPFAGEKLLASPLLTRDYNVAGLYESLKNILLEKSEFYEAYSSRFFHKIAGVPFSRYLNYIRISKAVNILHANEPMPVTDIASLCGFSTIRNFNRVFKDITGYTPTNIPRDYVIDEAFLSRKSLEGNPTLTECEIIECSSALP